jgi:FtsZ-binding cell division protein ZapB
MSESNTEQEANSESQETETGRTGIWGSVRQGVRVARERAVGTADTITGVQFRRQFEDFTDAVTTTVVGVHRDQEELQERTDKLDSEVIEVQRTQGELRERVDKLEQNQKFILPPALVIAFGIMSGLALIIGVISLVRTF